MKKKALALVMSLCLLVGLLPATVLAGEPEETACSVTLNYEESLCKVTAYELFMGEDGSNDPEQNKLIVTGNGKTAQIPVGTWLLLEISDIQSGYRIGSVMLNGADRTEGFVNGGYGSLSFKTQAGNYTLTAVMEEIPDSLPSVTAVTLYTDAAGTERAPENINYTSASKEDRLYGIASFSDGQTHPNYYATGQWQYSTDGTTWHDTETWGSNRFDFWPGWYNHKELNFLEDSYDLRLMVEPQDRYTTGEAVYSNVIHINGGASSQEHSWGEWVTSKPATCTEAGEEKHTCQVEGCGAVETKPIPALGHDLSYQAIDNNTTIQQTCSRCSHNATGSPSVLNYTYTGVPQGVSFISFGGWVRPYPKIWEANNDYVNAGEKTAYASIGGVTVSCSYTIFQVKDYTVTLGNLEQYSNNVTPVTWTTTPPDETAQAIVEYQVTTSGAPEWTTQLPTDVGSYPVRVKLTDSQNLVLKTGDEAYATGTLIISRDPSSGGSSSGSSSSGNKTETERNPDGSTTTTVTRPDGTVTETTKNPDGSQEVVETKKDGTVTTTTTDKTGNKTEVVENPDGSSKTTITNQDGSSSTTTVSKNGKVESEVKLPSAVVEGAAEKNEVIALPIPEVPVSSDKQNAPTVTVDLPSDTSAKVEIPVENVTPGTVAVIIKADGTEEVIKTSLTTDNGVMVTLSDGDTVKIVENSKSFADVPSSYWGSGYIDFVTSREIFSGTGEGYFSPDLPMNRAMIVTVLAALDGADTSSTGGAWYEAGQRWAMANGISDGTNMEQSLTREQLAVMLWNYAGKPESSYSLTAYPDWTSTSDWAQQAMIWAVEEGLISNLNGALAPQGTATRAQVATILMRFVESEMN